MHSFLRPIPIITFFTLALTLRLLFIDLRPLHHDEAVNFHFFRQTISDGYYKYSHENYHGPLFFYLHAGLLALISNDSVFSLRLPEAICGATIAILPFFFLKITGLSSLAPAIISAILITISPSLQFYSGYFIHEIWLVLFCLLLTYYSLLYIDQPDQKRGIMVAFFLALCFCLKETIVLALPGMLLSGFILLGPKKTFNSLYLLGRYGPLILLTFILTITFVFTGGGQWPAGVREFALAFPQWFSRGVGDSGHFKPWYYYINLLWQTEPLACLSLLVLGVFYFDKDRSYYILVGSFFTLSAIITMVAYSFIPYKMPWLHIQWIPAMMLGTGCLIYYVISNSKGLILLLSFLVLIIFFSLQVKSFYLYWYKHPYGRDNPLSYVHSTADMVKATEVIIGHLNKNPETKVLIATSAWPLIYYFRNVSRQVDYSSLKEISVTKDRYPILLVPFNRINELFSEEFEKCWQKEYFRLSDYEEGYLLTNICKLTGK
jgi:uncharacterized protein (TIGR03663 family)